LIQIKNPEKDNEINGLRKYVIRCAVADQGCGGEDQLAG
jgi:hypothetical protein